VAICTAVPLLVLFVVTIAVRLPVERGLVENVTVNDVAVAVVTVPTAPLLKTTVLWLAVVSKPKPLIVMVAALAATLDELLVMTGVTVATCTDEPATLFVVTVADKLPAVAGCVEKVTVSEVAVAAVTVPAAPLSKATVLLLAVVSNPRPLIVIVVASAVRLSVLLVTAGVTVATCTAEPLPTPSDVTTAVRLPAASGSVVKTISSSVAVAAVIVPAAPSLKTTLLLATMGSKPVPWITMAVASAARFDVSIETVVSSARSSRHSIAKAPGR